MPWLELAIVYNSTPKLHVSLAIQNKLSSSVICHQKTDYFMQIRIKPYVVTIQLTPQQKVEIGKTVT